MTDTPIPREAIEAAQLAMRHAGEPYLPSYDAMEAALTAALPHFWRDISTAPRDGTQILCGYAINGKWLDEYYVLAYFPNWHGDGQGAWVLNGDFSVRFMPSEYHETPPIEFGEPTHWMPLHPPPGEMS